MDCPNPVTIVVPFDRLDDTQTTQLVPCGKCLVCLSNKRSEWIVRLYYEHRYSVGSYFVTLTYDRKHLPSDGKLCKRDLQLFFKRLRKLNEKLRYFAVGEYGSKTSRPHYHALIFGDLNPETVRKAWKNGLTHIGTVTQKSIAYCTKYVVQPQKDGAFTLMSRRYAIGGMYLTDDTIAWHREDDRNYCILDGIRYKLPRFFKEKIWPSVKPRYDKKAGNKPIPDWKISFQEDLQYKYDVKRKSLSNKTKWKTIKQKRKEIRRLKELGIKDVRSYMADQLHAYVSRIKTKVEYTQTF